MDLVSAFNTLADEPQLIPTEPMLTSLRVPVVVVLCYWALVLALKYVVVGTGADRRLYPLNRWFALHNYILTAMSVLLWAGMLWTVVKIGVEYGAYALYCGTPHADVNTAALNWGNYFYLSKYYELLDTVFLVLRGRPLSLLHVFHHSVVVVVCWLAVHDAQAMGWITVLNNTFVHIGMYYYFARTVSGQKLWWRKWVTRIQILQFILDGTTSLPFAYLWYTGVACRGSMRAWGVGNAAGAALFFLFAQFSQNDDAAAKAKRSVDSAAAANTTATKAD